ncbi:MAG: hypothetical protein KDK51_02250 [Deltaproteobacteria bacterium]|nr:hypothetical protein [Deltaproteobacteria bacterium]
MAATGCGQVHNQEQTLFDKKYQSYCTVVQDLVHFTLKHHVSWHPDDFDHVTQKTLQQFRKNLPQSSSIEGDLCSSLQELYQAQQQGSEEAFYRQFIETYMQTLDAHSQYTPPDQVKAKRDRTEGKTKSSGIEFYYRSPDIRRFSDKNFLVIDYLHDDSYPSLAVGQRVQKIFTTPVLSFAWQDLMDVLEGKQNIEMSMSEGKVIVDRYKFNYPPFYIKEMKQDDALILWVRLMEFTRGSVAGLTEVLDQYKHADAIIMDLRGNPGGLLLEVEALLDYFLPPQHIYSEVNYSRSRLKKYRLKIPQRNDLPLTVLIDSGSASASEIFAGAIHIAKRGTLMGNYTFGKMSAQTPYLLSQKNGIGGMITLTQDLMVFSDRSTAQWHRITPDVWFKDPEVDMINHKNWAFYEYQLPSALKPSEPALSKPDHMPVIASCEIDNLRDCSHARITAFVYEQLH